MRKKTLVPTLMLALAFLLWNLALAAPGPKIKDPRARFKAFLAAFRNSPDNPSIREEIIKLWRALKPLPAVPQEALTHFYSANGIMKAAQSPDDYKSAADEYQKALLLAPWWANAYYNLSQADEGAHQYDDAIQALKYYLLTGPKDAAEIQGRIGELQGEKTVWEKESQKEAAEKQAEEKKEAAQKAAEQKAELSQKYVSGGAERVELSYLQRTNGGANFGTGDLFTYIDPADPDYFPNVFKFSNGKVIAVDLVPHWTPANEYDHDLIEIYDVTNGIAGQGERSEFGENETSFALGGSTFSISYMGTGDGMQVVVQDTLGSSATLSIDDLYRWRAENPSNNSITVGNQSYRETGASAYGYGLLLYWPSGMVDSAASTSNPRSLVPTYVVPVNTATSNHTADYLPLGSSGYGLKWNGSTWDVVQGP